MKLNFEVVKKKTLSFWVTVLLAAVLGLVYLIGSVLGVMLFDQNLFQNSGAIGVAFVIVLFAIMSQFEARRMSWHFIASSLAISDLMVSSRKTTLPQPGEVTFEQAGATVQKSFSMMSEFHRKSDNWLLVEVLLLVSFTIQWGFGDMLINYFACGGLKC